MARNAGVAKQPGGAASSELGAKLSFALRAVAALATAIDKCAVA
jgi:hypothetical protein